eukprot:GHVU01227290.1.p2 GENE.GHVU01227290.1~~GHVU01227290.1.p2  ORF type:complete len:107 (-),score=1.51 GHVU01227290.1:64-384(-)
MYTPSSFFYALGDVSPLELTQDHTDTPTQTLTQTPLWAAIITYINVQFSPFALLIMICPTTNSPLAIPPFSPVPPPFVPLVIISFHIHVLTDSSAHIHICPIPSTV